MENEIDIKCLFDYSIIRKKSMICIVLIFFLIANIVFFSFNNVAYSSVGKVEISNEATSNRIISYKDLLLSDLIITTAIGESHVDVNPIDVKKNLTINANVGSRVYTITLRHKNKDDGNRLCNSIIKNFINWLEVYDGSEAIISSYVVTNGGLFSYSLIKNEVFYALMGIVLSFGYIVVKFYLDKYIKSEKELYPYNILGIIDGKEENYSLVKTKIKLNNLGNVIFMGTPRDIECKDIILNLVKEFAKDSKVLFIDTNIRNKKSKNIGYSNLLNSYKGDITKYVKTDKYSVIDTGTIVDNVEVLLSNKNNEKLINSLKEKYDYIILYNSNIIDYSDSLILSKLCDCNYIVVEINKTEKKNFEKSLEVYNQVNSKVDGIIVVNKE